jgi:hypothetical protein
MPSKEGIDACYNAEKHDYLSLPQKADFSGIIISPEH